jgi:hypothetical protein
MEPLMRLTRSIKYEGDMGTIRRGVVSLNHHAGQYRIAPERHAGCPPRPAWPRSARGRASYFEHLGWTPSTAWATT